MCVCFLVDGAILFRTAEKKCTKNRIFRRRVSASVPIMTLSGAPPSIATLRRKSLGNVSIDTTFLPEEGTAVTEDEAVTEAEDMMLALEVATMMCRLSTRALALHGTDIRHT